MGAPIHITDATFEAEVIRSQVLTIIDFWAEWCMPCKRLAPLLEQIAEEHAGTLKVVKLDVDANPDTPGMFGINSIPTLLAFKGGEVVETIVGFMPKDKLLERLRPHLAPR